MNVESAVQKNSLNEDSEFCNNTNPEENRDSRVDETSSRKTTKIKKIYPGYYFIIDRDIFVKRFLYFRETDSNVQKYVIELC